MASEGPSLGDFFKSKGKKKIKASNFNKDQTTKTEEKKVVKSADDDVWEEEQVVAQTMKVEVAGKLVREEENKEDEDANKPAWGNVSKEKASNASINEKRFPSLAKANFSSSISVGDKEGTINIQTSKNVFAALEGDDDDGEDGSKRPKSINAASVSKKKGENEKAALQREVDKYKKEAKKAKKKAAEANKEGSEAEDDEESSEPEEEEEQAPKEVKKKKKPVEAKEDRSEDKKTKNPLQESNQDQDDKKIQPDDKAAKDKYKGRKRLLPKELPKEELQEQKENKPKANQQSNKSGKKKKFAVEEETEKKLAYAPF